MKDSRTFEPSNRGVSETHRPRRMLRSIGAVATWNAGPAFGPKWHPLAVIAIALPCA
jgi:hypothetical protein